MVFVAAGLGIVFLLMLLARGFVSVNPSALAQGLRWAGVGIAVLAIGAMTATGRFSFAGVLLPFLYALLQGRRPPWMRRGGGAAAQPSPGQSSSIRTAFLELTLDHDSGALTGAVLRGRFQGRRIESLDQAALIALWRETAAEDPPSAQLVETCLERSFPDWRDDAAAAAAPAAPSGAMSRAEALRILGLEGEPTPAQITEAHHRLMMAHHPDRGGSAYLAAMINEAKRVLTGSK